MLTYVISQRITQNSQLLIFGEPAGIRTQDTRLKRAVLYQLSYRPALAVFFKDAYLNKEKLLLSTKNRTS
jgi:hypothetical protein